MIQWYKWIILSYQASEEEVEFSRRAGKNVCMLACERMYEGMKSRICHKFPSKKGKDMGALKS